MILLTLADGNNAVKIKFSELSRAKELCEDIINMLDYECNSEVTVCMQYEEDQ